MNTEIWAIIAFATAIVMWSISIYVFKKFTNILVGKNWIIGCVGFIVFITTFWLIGVYVSVGILLLIAALLLPVWLNYMYYLGIKKRIRERLILNNERKI